METHDKDIIKEDFNSFLDSYQSGGFDNIETGDDSSIVDILDKETDRKQEGGAFTKKANLQSKDFKSTKTADGKYMLHPSDIKYLFSKIKDVYEQYDIFDVAKRKKQYQIKAFYILFYKTFYYLLMNIIINNYVKSSNDSGVVTFSDSSLLGNHLKQLEELEIDNSLSNDDNGRAKQYIVNANFIKSSKYDVNKSKNIKFLTGSEKAKYMTEYCQQIHKGDKMKAAGKGGKYDKTNQDISISVLTSFEDIFLSDKTMQKKLDKFATNKLKCILYYIRYNNVLFNYYLQKLLKLYSLIVSKSNEINKNFTETSKAEKEEIKKAYNDLRTNSYLTDSMRKVLTEKDINTAPNKITEFLGDKSNNYNVLFAEILNYINGTNDTTKFNNIQSILNDNYKDIFDATYNYEFIFKNIFTLYNYYTLTFAKTERLFGNVKPDGDIATETVLKSKDVRLAYLASAIPDCIRILIPYIKQYADIITENKSVSGIKHLAGIKPDLHAIQHNFVKFLKGDTVDDYTKYTNEVLLANFFVEQMTFVILQPLLFDDEEKLKEEQKKSYLRILTSSFNQTEVYSDNEELDKLRKKTEVVLKAKYSAGKTNDMIKKVFALIDDNKSKKANYDKAVNDCFDLLYEEVIARLLNNPIIINKKTNYEWASGLRHGAKRLFRYNLDNPNINKDIGNISRDINAIFTNLIASIEMGVYDFDKNVTFTKNFESIFSSLPLFYENIFKRYTTDKPEDVKYLLSNKLYEPISDDSAKAYLSNINFDTTNKPLLTSIETGLLSLEELVSMSYANYYLRDKSGTDKSAENTVDIKEIKKISRGSTESFNTTELVKILQSGGSDVGNVIGVGIGIVPLIALVLLIIGFVIVGFVPYLGAKLIKYIYKNIPANNFTKGLKDFFGSAITGTGKLSYELLSKLGFAKKIDEYYRTNPVFELQVLSTIFELSNSDSINRSNMKSKFDKIIDDIVDDKYTGEKEEKKTELKNNRLLFLVFTRQYELLYEIYFIYDKEQNTDSEEVKKGRELLIQFVVQKLMFMVNRIKNIVEGTPSASDLNGKFDKEEDKGKTQHGSYVKLYKKALSKAMMLMKMKQYVTDIAKVVTIEKDIDQIGTVPDDKLAKIPEYYAKLFADDATSLNTLRNIFVNQIQIDDTAIATTPFTGKIKDKEDNLNLPDLLKPYPTLLEILNYKYSSVQKGIVAEQMTGGAITNDDFLTITKMLRTYNGKELKFNDSITDINITRKEGLTDLKKTAINGFNFTQLATGQEFSYTNIIAHFGDDTSHSHQATSQTNGTLTAAANFGPRTAAAGGVAKNFGNALQNNIEALQNYFLESTHGVLNDTKDIDEVLLYKVNLHILSKFNEAQITCIDNFLQLEGDNTNFVTANSETVTTKFAVVLKLLITKLQAITGFNTNITGIRDVYNQLTKYYLMVSYVKNIEYLFHKLIDVNSKTDNSSTANFQIHNIDNITDILNYTFYIYPNTAGTVVQMYSDTGANVLDLVSIVKPADNIVEDSLSELKTAITEFVNTDPNPNDNTNVDRLNTIYMLSCKPTNIIFNAPKYGIDDGENYFDTLSYKLNSDIKYSDDIYTLQYISVGDNDKLTIETSKDIKETLTASGGGMKYSHTKRLRNRRKTTNTVRKMRLVKGATKKAAKKHTKTLKRKSGKSLSSAKKAKK